MKYYPMTSALWFFLFVGHLTNQNFFISIFVLTPLLEKTVDYISHFCTLFSPMYSFANT